MSKAQYNARKAAIPALSSVLFSMGSVRLIRQYVKKPLATSARPMTPQTWKAWHMLRQVTAIYGANYGVLDGNNARSEPIYVLQSFRGRIASKSTMVPLKQRYTIKVHAQAWFNGKWTTVDTWEPYSVTDQRLMYRWEHQKQWLDAARRWLTAERQYNRTVEPRHGSMQRRLSQLAQSVKMPKTNDRWASIEMEFASAVSIDEMSLALARKGLHRYVCVKSDGSITTTAEHPHRIECVVTAPITEMPTIVPRICDVIKAQGAAVNNSCGLHVHLDCRNDRPDDVYMRLQRSQNLLFAAVPTSRRENTYCKKILHPTFRNAADMGNRYHAVNAQAYRAHKTIEVRLGAATLKADKIVSWVMLLADIGYTPLTKQPVTPDMWATLKDMADHMPLAASTIETLRNRVQRYSPTLLSTLINYAPPPAIATQPAA